MFLMANRATMRTDGRQIGYTDDDHESQRRSAGETYIIVMPAPAGRHAVDAERGDVAAVHRVSGERLNNPSTGPAHQTASGQGLGATASNDSGSAPRASSTTTPSTISTSGPATAMSARSPRDGRRRDVRRVADEEVERDGRVGAEAAGQPGVAELVDERERRQRGDQPRAERPAVEDGDQGDDARRTRARIVTGKPKSWKRAPSDQSRIVRAARRPVSAATAAATGAGRAEARPSSRLEPVPYVYAFDHKHRRPPWT